MKKKYSSFSEFLFEKEQNLINLENKFNKLKDLLREKGTKINFNVLHSSVKREENLKDLLKTKEGKEFIKVIKDIPEGTKITQKNWANEFTKTGGNKIYDSFARKKLGPIQFALDRIRDNSTTGSYMNFE